MKKYALLFSFLFCLSAFSQQDSVQKPFFYAKKFHSAFFVQFEGQGAYVFNKVSMISGIGVYYPNGNETQRIGILPDIEYKPTINGIRNGEDELLNKAIDLINSN